MTACDDCLRRTDLIAAMAGHLQIEFKRRSAPGRVLALHDEDLLELAAQATIRRRYADFDASAARARATAAALTTICGCRDAYPERLRDLADPPAVLHVRGDPAALQGRGGGGGRRCAEGVVVRDRRSRARSGAGCRRRRSRSSPVSRSAWTRPRTRVRWRRAGATIGVLAGSAHIAYPARGWRLHAAVARARRGDLRAAAGSRRRTAGASSPATGSSPRSAR